MIHVINFADNSFKKKQKLNSITARFIGGADKVTSFGIEDVEKSYYEGNIEIFKESRGFGCWLWKSYFINKIISESSDGDIIMYIDSGSFFVNKISTIVNQMLNNGDEIYVFELPLIEAQWTKGEVFDYFDGWDEFRFSNQVMATSFIFKVGDFSRAFFSEFKSICEDKNLLTDLFVNDNKNLHLIDHRHDQSVLSLLSKKYNLKPHRDPSDYGVFPFRYFRRDVFFNLKSYSDTYPVVFLSTRKENALLYLLKYILRRCIGRFLRRMLTSVKVG